MKKYRCTICGHIYDEAVEGVKFADLPDDWKCPLCGAPKSLFEEVVEETPKQEEKENISTRNVNVEVDEDLRELSNAEIAYICSNLAKGAEKEYKEEEQKLFLELSKHYESLIEPTKGNLNDVKKLVDEDDQLFQDAFAVADKYNDRGSKRVLTWASKTTNIIKSVLDNYEEKGIDYLKNTKIWVCDICGFVYIGDNPPEVCPICKVPSLKIMEVK